MYITWQKIKEYKKKSSEKMKKEVKILLIIPAYNEEANILKVYKSIVNYNKKYKTKYDVIVINDGSTDNTYNICNNDAIESVIQKIKEFLK